MGRFFLLSVPYKIIQRHTLQRQVIEIHTKEEIRERLLNGQVSIRDGLLHPDLTGDKIIEIGDIAEFQSVLQSNDFWLQSRLQNSSRDIPLFTILLIALFLSTFFFFSEESLTNNALHWSYILWDQNWWCPVSSSFFHVDLRHLCINLVFFTYTSFFFERIVNIYLYIQTLIWSCVCVSLGSVLWGSEIVVGSSFWIYSILGAMISIGWRCPNGLHYPYNRILGWGAYTCFFLLFFISLPSNHVSQLSHICGFFAGFTSLGWLDLRSRKSHMISCIIGACALMLIPYLGISVDEERVHIRNVELTIPQKHRTNGKNPVSVYFDGNPSIYVETTWNPKHNLFKFKDMLLEKDMYEYSQDVHLQYFQTTTNTKVLVRYFEQGSFRGQILCVAHSEIRKDLCETWLKEATITEPVVVTFLRERVAEEPESRRAKFNLAEQLMLMGSYQEADKISTVLQKGQDMLAQQSAIMRVYMRSKKPESWSVEEDLIWIQPLLREPSIVDPIHIWSCLYFSYHKKFQYCEQSPHHNSQR